MFKGLRKKNARHDIMKSYGVFFENTKLFTSVETLEFSKMPTVKTAGVLKKGHSTSCRVCLRPLRPLIIYNQLASSLKNSYSSTKHFKSSKSSANRPAIACKSLSAETHD